MTPPHANKTARDFAERRDELESMGESRGIMRPQVSSTLAAEGRSMTLMAVSRGAWAIGRRGRQPSLIIHVYIKVECALQLMLNEIPITTTNFNERYLAADPAHTCLLPLCHPFSFGAVCHSTRTEIKSSGNVFSIPA